MSIKTIKAGQKSILEVEKSGASNQEPRSMNEGTAQDVLEKSKDRIKGCCKKIKFKWVC